MVPLSLQGAQSQGRGNLLLYLGWQADARRLDGKQGVAATRGGAVLECRQRHPPFRDE